MPVVASTGVAEVHDHVVAAESGGAEDTKHTVRDSITDEVDSAAVGVKTAAEVDSSAVVSDACCANVVEDTVCDGVNDEVEIAGFAVNIILTFSRTCRRNGLPCRRQLK